MFLEKWRCIYKCYYYVIRKLKKWWINGKIKIVDSNWNELVILNIGNIGVV